MAHVVFLERNSDNEKISRKEIIDQIPVFCFINMKYAKDTVLTPLKKNPKIRVDKKNNAIFIHCIYHCRQQTVCCF